MRRRDVLAGAGSLAAGATLSFPTPAIAQGIRQLKMVTDWPEESPGIHPRAVRLAQTIGAATGGRIKIEVYPSGALVRPFETFDAVGAGVADMYHSYEDYWEKKSPAFNSSRPCPSASPRMNCSRGFSTAAARNCGTRSAVNSTSSRSSAATPVARWADGSPARSPRRKISRGCATAWPGPAPRCSGGWAPSW